MPFLQQWTCKKKKINKIVAKFGIGILLLDTIPEQKETRYDDSGTNLYSWVKLLGQICSHCQGRTKLRPSC